MQYGPMPSTAAVTAICAFTTTGSACNSAPMTIGLQPEQECRACDDRVGTNDDGALIHMSCGGRAVFPDRLEASMRDVASRHLIDPAQCCFRTVRDRRRAICLDGIVAVGGGRLIEGGVAYDVLELT
jgi:hypothetical protein